MPRIAASMMVVAVVVCSIGLNIQRYPVVWQMAAAPRPVSQSEESSSTETPSQEENAWDSADFSQSDSPVESVDTGYSYDDSSQTYQDDSSYDPSPYTYSPSYENETSNENETWNENEPDEYSRQDNAYQTDSSADPYSHSGSYAEKSGGSSEEGAEYGSSGSEAYSHGSSAGSSYQDYRDQDSRDTGQDAYGAYEQPIANHEYEPYEYQPAEQRSFGDTPGLAGADSRLDSGYDQTPVGSSRSSEYGANWPAEAAPADKYGSAAAQPGVLGDDWDREKPLVPVIRDDAPYESYTESYTPVAAGPTRGLGVEADLAGRVRRLPPIELEQPIPTDNYANRLPESPIPVYPSTGY